MQRAHRVVAKFQKVNEKQTSEKYLLSGEKKVIDQDYVSCLFFKHPH